VKRLSGTIHEETRSVLNVFMENLIQDAVTSMGGGRWWQQQMWFPWRRLNAPPPVALVVKWLQHRASSRSLQLFLALWPEHSPPYSQEAHGLRFPEGQLTPPSLAGRPEAAESRTPPSVAPLWGQKQLSRGNTGCPLMAVGALIFEPWGARTPPPVSLGAGFLSRVKSAQHSLKAGECAWGRRQGKKMASPLPRYAKGKAW